VSATEQAVSGLPGIREAPFDEGLADGGDHSSSHTSDPGPIWARSVSTYDLGALSRISETVRAQKRVCDHPHPDRPGADHVDEPPTAFAGVVNAVDSSTATPD
jgi:hypothetical protein